MSPEESAAAALVIATSVHVGFQVVVTFLVYPAFRDVPLNHWATYHSDHSRRITGIVVVVYAGLVGASAYVMTAGPRNAGTVTAVALSALAILTTAFVAAPAHGRLSPDRRERDLARLIRADRVRLVAAVLGAGAAVVGLAL